MSDTMKYNRWDTRSRYHDGSRRPLPNTFGFHEGQFVWILTSFRDIILEQVSRVSPQYAWCGSSIKIRLSNGLAEMPRTHWHGRAFTSLEAAEKGEMPMTFKQFRLLVALGEKPEELYTQDIAWASDRLDGLSQVSVPDWGRFRGVVL